MNKPLRMLLVDDNPHDRLLIISELRCEFPNLQVEEIIDERTFTAALKAGNFDIAVTDFQLDWTNGLKVLYALKARYPDRPLIMFTSTSTEEIAVEAMKAGLDDYLIKDPQHFVRLPVAVRAALERSGAKLRTARLESRLQALLNNLSVGVFRTTLDGHLLEGNPAFLRLLGCSSLQEAQAQGLQVLYASPEDCTRLLNELQSRGRSIQREMQVRRADGSLIWVSVSEVLSPINGQAVIDGLLEDITDRKQAEEELEQSNQQVMNILESITDAFFALDRQWQFTYLNRQAEPLLGRTRDDLIGKNVWDEFPEAVGSTFYQKYHEAVTEQVAVSFEEFYPPLNTWFEVHAYPGPDGLSVYFRDITERKRAEEELRQSEERFRLLVEGARDHAMFMLTPDGHVISWNSGAQRLLGYRAEEILGRHFSICLTPEDRQAGKAERELQQAMTEGHAADDNWVVRKDGSRFWASGVTTPLWDQDGNLRGFAKIIRDLTERKRAEVELEARTCQQAAVAEFGQRALAITDLSELMNEASALVAKTLSVEHCKIMELLPDGNRLLLRAGVGWKEEYVGHATVGASADTHAGHTLRSRTPVVVEDLRTETRFRTPPLLQEHGVVSAMSVVIHGHNRPFGILQADTTRRRKFTEDDIHFLQSIANVLATAIERKRAEEAARSIRDEAERLAELDRLRRDFISSISHDLRTPLTAMRAGLGMLETSTIERLRPDEQKLMHNIRRNIEHLNIMIDDLLALNQLEARALHLDREPLDLRTVLTDALSIVHPLIREKGQTLEVDLPEPLLIEGDRRRLVQVVVDLLANAYRHTPAGTRIAISGWGAADEVLLAVRDSGPGIPAEELESIFQRFHTLGTGTGGSGLGLAIAKGIIELHGGRIWAESQLGQGASFHIALPHYKNGG